jgi:hypothetical protein
MKVGTKKPGTRDQEAGNTEQVSKGIKARSRDEEAGTRDTHLSLHLNRPNAARSCCSSSIL